MLVRNHTVEGGGEVVLVWRRRETLVGTQAAGSCCALCACTICRQTIYRPTHCPENNQNLGVKTESVTGGADATELSDTKNHCIPSIRDRLEFIQIIFGTVYCKLHLIILINSS